MLPISPAVFSIGEAASSRIIASIFSSASSGSLYPSELNILIPLYSHGLCEAEIITPASKEYSLTRKATAGVGITPESSTSQPTEQNPAANAAVSISADFLVSVPINTLSLSFSLPEDSTAAVALPIFKASSQPISVFAIPLAPSVPNNLPIKKLLHQLSDGTGRPRCIYAAFVTTLPRGVLAKKPACIRYGS